MTDPLGYVGKRVVVTGCASGIGRAAARLLLDRGAEVHGLDIAPSPDALAGFTRLDLRDPEAIAAAAEGIGGRVDALFNCAGIPPGPAWLDVVKVNFIGLRSLTHALLPYMPRGAAVVSVASTGGARWSQHLKPLLAFLQAATYAEAVRWCEANPELPTNGYGFSKEAVIVWTLQSARFFIERGVRINCTSPGAVQTPMLDLIEKASSAAVIDVVAQPIGRRSSPEEQALPLLMLNSEAAAYVNGALLAVDGGFMAEQTVRAAGSG